MKSKTSKPLVSILIPVYNGTEFLDEAINSILDSTYSNIEIIMVDDGSTDESRHKCRKYARRYKNIHSYGFKKNQGMTRCLNYGIKKARGKYIARINQDDIMVPDRLEKQVKFLETHPSYVIVGGAIQLFTLDHPDYDKIAFPLSDKQIRAQWLLLSPYSDPTVMYRKDAWLKTEGYSQYFWPADDAHMWYQLGNIGKISNLPDVLTKVRWHNGAGSIKSHRRQMLKTWQVHNWAAEMVRKPVLYEKCFWFAQLIAGLIFPANFNWWIYRLIRKIQHFYLDNLKSLSFSSQTILYTKKLNKLSSSVLSPSIAK